MQNHTVSETQSTHTYTQSIKSARYDWRRWSIGHQSNRLLWPCTRNSHIFWLRASRPPNEILSIILTQGMCARQERWNWKGEKGWLPAFLLCKQPHHIKCNPSYVKPSGCNCKDFPFLLQKLELYLRSLLFSNQPVMSKLWHPCRGNTKRALEVLCLSKMTQQHV